MNTTSSSPMAFSSATDLSRRLLRCLLHLSLQARNGRAEAELPSTPLQVLGILRRRGRATATEIAAELRIQKQSLTTLLSMLHTRGCLVRETDPADARRVLLGLTPEGEALLSRDLLARRVLLERLLEERLSGEERASFEAALPVLEKLAFGGEE